MLPGGRIFPAELRFVAGSRPMKQQSLGRKDAVAANLHPGAATQASKSRQCCGARL